MKKTVRIAALMLVLVMTVFVFASCGKTIAKGTYESNFGTVYEFNGKNYEASVIGRETGTYEVDRDAGEITFTPEGKDSYTVSFAEGEENGTDYVKISGITYYKK